MSHKHKVIIEKLFAHPIATNIDWKKLVHALEHFGAEVDMSKSNKAKVLIRNREIILSVPHHGHELTNKTEVIKLKHFLEEIELTPKTL